MGTPTSPSPAYQQSPPPQFSAELPSTWEGGGNTNAPPNTQFRHELPEQKPQAPYIPPWGPFSIVTENDSLSSNFPYNSRLRDLRVTPDQWLQFTTEVINAAKLTFAEDAAAWTTGVTTGTLTSPFLLVFAPVVGYYAGKSVHKKAVAKKVKEKLAVEGPLRATLRQWNEGVFLERGIQLWLEPPKTNGEVIVDAPQDATPEQIAKIAKKQVKRFRFICTPYDPRNKPLGTNYSPTSPLQSQNSWSAGQSTPSQSPVSPEGRMFVNADGKWNGHTPPAGPVEVSAVRPVAELHDEEKKLHDPIGSERFEMDGSSPQLAKEKS
ncbi:uncharacterized protein LY89DRAFT_737192 [Mollisia scopiformis]|uniref:Uncharacterized protein n=1 Tax=Mollisia scopiformis TaxID=149040 RepID=A0A194WZ30_MOLSC|nr:uncharacterized protein LY89DRAFT_737192 [Mollisia scopiformis]KUJ13213.1 hypothetical protein LY89DRAFT_737192 [Mollisia scopiformis]